MTSSRGKKNVYSFAVAVAITFLVISTIACDQGGASATPTPAPAAATPTPIPFPDFAPTTITLSYDWGSSGNNIYTVWAENPAQNYYQPFAICERLLGPDPDDDTLITNQPEVLPFWHLGAFTHMDQSEVDAVTGPSLRKQDITFTISLAPDAPRQFTLYFECDYSFDKNDWFNDQPSIIYKADVDLDEGSITKQLAFMGWAAHTLNIDSARADTGNAALAKGELVTETRYITHFASPAPSPGAFGGTDSRGANQQVNGLTLTIQ